MTGSSDWWPVQEPDMPEMWRPWHPFRRVCGLGGTIYILTVLSLIIVFPILWWETQTKARFPTTDSTPLTDLPTQTHTRYPRRVGHYMSGCNNVQLWVPGAINITFTLGQMGSVKVDACSVLNFNGNDKSLNWADKYLFCCPPKYQIWSKL